MHLVYQLIPPGRPDAQHSLAAVCAVIADSEAVRLGIGEQYVAFAALDDGAVAADVARAVLFVFDDTYHGDLHAILLEHALGRVYLRGRAVDRDDAGHRPFVVAQAARKDFAKRTRIVARRRRAYAEFAIVALLRLAVLDDDHHAHMSGAREMRHVVGFDTREIP